MNAGAWESHAGNAAVPGLPSSIEDAGRLPADRPVRGPFLARFPSARRSGNQVVGLDVRQGGIRKVQVPAAGEGDVKVGAELRCRGL